MKIFQGAFLFYLLLLAGYVIEEHYPEILENCAVIREADILSEEKRKASCCYFKVYEFDRELYRTCVCCLCIKSSFPIDCDNNQLCTAGPKRQECLDQFRADATYLFSISN